MSKIVPKTFQSLLIALVVGVTLLLGNLHTPLPAPASDVEVVDICETPSKIPDRREIGWVQEINVKDLNVALEYYQYVLQMSCNPNFYNPPLSAEVFFDFDPSTSIKLSTNPDRPVITQIVPDLASACSALKDTGIPIEESRYAGSGVCLAFFSDDSGNKLAYRQETETLFDTPENLCNQIVKNQCSPGLDWSV